MTDITSRTLLDLSAAANAIEMAAADASLALSEGQLCCTRHGRRGAMRLALVFLLKARADAELLIAELKGRL